jgi:hypothetical protein
MGFKDAGKPHYLGHRERLRQRFREGGADAIPDYELLELILFRAVPRRDTKPLAKAILARFGSFAEAVNAPEALLREVPGLGESAVIEIKLVRAAALRLVRGEVLERPVLASWSQVLDYCRASMGFENQEQFRIFVPMPNLNSGSWSRGFSLAGITERLSLMPRFMGPMQFPSTERQSSKVEFDQAARVSRALAA